MAVASWLGIFPFLEITSVKAGSKSQKLWAWIQRNSVSNFVTITDSWVALYSVNRHLAQYCGFWASNRTLFILEMNIGQNKKAQNVFKYDIICFINLMFFWIHLFSLQSHFFLWSIIPLANQILAANQIANLPTRFYPRCLLELWLSICVTLSQLILHILFGTTFIYHLGTNVMFSFMAF